MRTLNINTTVGRATLVALAAVAVIAVPTSAEAGANGILTVTPGTIVAGGSATLTGNFTAVADASGLPTAVVITLTAPPGVTITPTGGVFMSCGNNSPTELLCQWGGAANGSTASMSATISTTAASAGEVGLQTSQFGTEGISGVPGANARLTITAQPTPTTATTTTTTTTTTTVVSPTTAASTTSTPSGPTTPGATSTTTTVAGATTTNAASGGGTATSTTRVAASSGLPVTGSSNGWIAVLALVFLAVGAVLLVHARRPHDGSPSG
jgi:LPXTG-motif cell wall-anchored protein